MACITCGRPCLQVFCSNGCFAARSSSAECAICQVDPRTGQRGNLVSHKICARCEADPVNQDWVEGRELLLPPASAAYESANDPLELHAAEQRHADVMDKRLRPVTRRQREILELAICGETIRVQRWRRSGRRRRRWGTYQVQRALSFRAIARLTSSSHTYVAKVIRAQLEA